MISVEKTIKTFRAPASSLKKQSRPLEDEWFHVETNQSHQKTKAFIETRISTISKPTLFLKYQTKSCVSHCIHREIQIVRKRMSSEKNKSAILGNRCFCRRTNQRHWDFSLEYQSKPLENKCFIEKPITINGKPIKLFENQ